MKEYLQGLIDKQQTARVLLFCGQDVQEKESATLAFATALLGPKVAQGLHPDYHVYKPEGKLGMHSIASMRQLIQEVYMPPYEASNKIFIIYGAEKMLPTSANALLKTLEEPASHTTLILFAPSTQELLPTIVSRCQTLYFPNRLIVPVYDALSVNVLTILSDRMNYLNLMQSIKEITAELETIKKRLEKDSGKEILGTQSLKDFSPQQQEVILKDIEGAVATQITALEAKLFDVIFSWYRDIYLIKMGGPESLLIHKKYASQLHALALLPQLPLAAVQKAIKEALLAKARSTSFSIILENLFLKLCSHA